MLCICLRKCNCRRISILPLPRLAAFSVYTHILRLCFCFCGWTMCPGLQPFWLTLCPRSNLLVLPVGPQTEVLFYLLSPLAFLPYQSTPSTAHHTQSFGLYTALPFPHFLLRSYFTPLLPFIIGQNPEGMTTLKTISWLLFHSCIALWSPSTRKHLFALECGQVWASAARHSPSWREPHGPCHHS